MADPLRKADADQTERLHRFAHDIRNKLTAIHEVVRHLLDPVEGMDRDELGEFEEQQYFKALSEIEALQDDLGVDRSFTLTDPGRIALSVLIVQAIQGLEHRFNRKEQTVRFDRAQEPVVLGDARSLSEVISALLSNASKFSPKGSRITIELEQDGMTAILRVKDQGIGLDEEDSNGVFVRFAWLKGRSTDGEAQGRGTLARARSWAQAHGGDLLVASDGPGKGSTFTFRCPVHRA